MHNQLMAWSERIFIYQDLANDLACKGQQTIQ